MKKKSQAEIILKQLFESHFFSSGLEWIWVHGKSLKDVDPELYIQIITNFPEVIKDK